MVDRLKGYGDLLLRQLRSADKRVNGDPAAVSAAARLRDDLLAYNLRPLPFVRDCLGEGTIPASRAILRALIKHKRVHVCGCRKSSKSHTAAQAILAMTCTAPTRCIVTSATFTQVRENMFAKVRSLHGKAKRPLPGRLGVTSLRMDDPNWFAKGISTNKPGNIMGFHGDVHLDPALEYDDEWVDEDSLLAPDPRALEEDLRLAERDPADVVGEAIFDAKRDHYARLFFVLDEMAEMRPDIVEAIWGSIMGENVYLLSQFNPTFPPESKHPAARLLQEDSGVFRIHIAGRVPSPDMHGPEAGQRGSLFDQCIHGMPQDIMPDKWVAEMLARWGGPEAALSACHIFGLPAHVQREREFIPFRILREQFTKPTKDSGKVTSRHMGWDVGASEKGDLNVCQLWVNGSLTAEEKWREPDTLVSADRVIELRFRWGVGDQPIPGRNIHVDKLGVGTGACNYLRRMGLPIDAVDFGGSPAGDWPKLVGDQPFVNRKAELLWILRRGLETGIFHIPRSFPDTVTQCQWYTIGEQPSAEGTKIKCAERREEIVKTFGRSPDELSAAMLACSRTGGGFSITSTNSLGGARDALSW